jgi:hypothetical protein
MLYYGRGWNAGWKITGRDAGLAELVERAMSLPEAARNLLYAFHENGILILAAEFRD